MTKKASDKKMGQNGLPILPYNIGNSNPENLLNGIQNIINKKSIREKYHPCGCVDRFAERKKMRSI